MKDLRDAVNPHSSTPPQRDVRMRWLRSAIAALVGALVLIAVAATFLPRLLARGLRMETEIWSEESGLPASPRFRYLLFPTEEAIAYDDVMLSNGPLRWNRVLLNELPEQDARAISARDAATGVLRYVDGATMSLLPDDPADVPPALAAFVTLVGQKRDPQIRRLSFEVCEQNGSALAKLEVADTRATDIYEYSVANGKVIPRRWTRRLGYW
jgi:hypothetical protein